MSVLMQSPRENPTSDLHYVKLPDDTAAPATRTYEPQRSRANSDRGVRATKPLASFRPLARVATMHEEPRRATTTDNSAVPFLRTLSMLGFTIASDEPHDNMFCCHVCFDDVVVTEAVALTSCDHKFCAPCLNSYLELKITEGNVYPVCFHPIDNADATCGVAVTADQIEQLVAPEVYTKYETFRFNKEHQHARECPYCPHSQERSAFFHGNAHEDGTCADYKLKHAHEEALSRAKIAKISKPCPGCHCDVEKDGGCNHMKCVGCKTNFCWLCGEMVEDMPYPSHYAAGSGGSCSGMQFDGVEPNLNLEAEPERVPIWRWITDANWRWITHANWRWIIGKFIYYCVGREPDEQRVLSPGEWAAGTLTAILFFLVILAPTIVVFILLVLYSLCWRSDIEPEGAFGTVGSWLLLTVGTLLNLVFTPLGWVIDLAVAIVNITVGVIAEIRTRCFSCCCRSGPSTADTPAGNDLEAGLVEASAPGGEPGSVGLGETRAIAV